jgi:hypothetical protein
VHVRHFICAAIAEAGIEGVPVSGEEGADDSNCRHLELMRPLQYHLPVE